MTAEGINVFSFVTLEEFTTEEESFEAEQFWIEYFRSWDPDFGYNRTLGGKGIPGYVASEEQRSAVSRQMLGNTYGKGVKHTDEWRRQKREQLTGTKNHKAKLTEHDVRDIRQFHAENIRTRGAMVFEKLMAKYGLSLGGLEKIVYRHNWRHI